MTPNIALLGGGAYSKTDNRASVIVIARPRAAAVRLRDTLHE